MGQVVKFLGWLLLSIVATLVIFTHVSMLFVYDAAYVLDTIWPSNPDDVPSVYIGIVSLIPGGLMIGAGYLIEKYVPDVDDVSHSPAQPASEAATDSETTPEAKD